MRAKVGPENQEPFRIFQGGLCRNGHLQSIKNENTAVCAKIKGAFVLKFEAIKIRYSWPNETILKCVIMVLKKKF